MKDARPGLLLCEFRNGLIGWKNEAKQDEQTTLTASWHEVSDHYGRQRANIEQVATALFEMRQAFDIDLHHTRKAGH